MADIFSKFSLLTIPIIDVYLGRTMDGDSHNDIKRGYLKCWSSMAEADIVFPYPIGLARMAVVSEKVSS
jgi:hypothetical protein